MNRKLCALIAIFCVVQSAFSAHIDDFSYPGKDWSDADGAEMRVGFGDALKPPPPGLKLCCPGFCCPIALDCRGLFCHDPVTGTKEHSVLVC